MGTTATPERKKRVADRVEREFRLYRIVAGDLGDRCKAIAYLGTGSIVPVEPVEASSVDEAINMIEAALEARLAEMRRERRDGVPIVAEFREAIAALPMAVRDDIRNLQIDRLDPVSSQSPLEALSMRKQLDAEIIADHLRKAARQLADLLDAKPEGADKDADPLCLMATVDGSRRDTVTLLNFHEEFLQALASLPPERPVVVARRR